MGGNVPLNNALDAFNISTASAEDLAYQRMQFEAPWNRLHQIRTIANAIALVPVILACLQPAGKHE
jgi:uncharacterized membrane protein